MHQLEEKSSNLSKVLPLIIGATLAFLGIFFAVGLASGDGGFEIVAFLIPAGFCLVVFLIMGWIAFARYMAGRHATAPEILISSPAVRVGENVIMNYRQTFKRDVNVEKLSLKLIMRERATYQRGTDTVTVTHDFPIDEFGYNQHHFVAGQMLNDEWQFKIPRDGMHTFKANRNEILWLLQVHVDVANTRFDFKREYVIQVMPQLAEN
jgi:hypothetical protein